MDSSEIAELSTVWGLGEVRDLQQLPAGLGGNELWRLRSDVGELVLRIFPAGRLDAAEREVQAHQFVRRHGLAAPKVIGSGLLGDRPVLGMEWVDGRRLAELLFQGDGSAAELGRRCGELLGRLHSLPAGELPAGLIGSRPWIEWAGDLAEGLAPDLAELDGWRLLHLDFHPENLILTANDGLVLLDWANVRLGPPAAELARTDSILELVRYAHPEITDREREILDDFRTHLLSGYAAAGGVPEIPASARAWAYAVQLHDLAGSWVPDAYLDQLRARVDRFIAGG